MISQIMPVKHRALAVFLGTALAAAASTITFAPTYPKDGPGHSEGAPCTPGVDVGCVIGEVGTYAVFGGSLTQPTVGNPIWVLTIQMNYGDPTLNLIPGSPDVIPTFAYNDGLGNQFSIGDFILQWNSKIYGVVLHPHDGYTAGNLYLANGFQTSKDIMDGKANQIPNPNHIVWIAAGGTQVGAGTLTGAKTGSGDGTQNPLYTITAQFSAPAGFLSAGGFNIDFTTYACANGDVSSYTQFITGGGGGDVPEPSTLLLVPAALIFGFVRIRQSRTRI